MRVLSIVLITFILLAVFCILVMLKEENQRKEARRKANVELVSEEFGADLRRIPAPGGWVYISYQGYVVFVPDTEGDRLYRPSQALPVESILEAK